MLQDLPDDFMTYRPTISILHTTASARETTAIADALMCKWPCGMPPLFSTKKSVDCDVAILFAENENAMIEILPILLELHTSNVAMLVCCDDFDAYKELIADLDVTHIAYYAEPSSIA